MPEICHPPKTWRLNPFSQPNSLWPGPIGTSSRRIWNPHRHECEVQAKGATYDILSKISQVCVMRPCGRLLVVPMRANPPVTLIVGTPTFSGSLVASTTPGSGLPSGPRKIEAALKSVSWTRNLVTLRDAPKRNSLRKVGENVCVSVSTNERLSGELELPPF